MEPEHHLIQERIRKLNELKELGVEPYPYSYEVTHKASDIREKYDKLKEEEKTKDKVKVAGRIMQLRKMGKASFAHLQDSSGKIQFYIRQDDVGEDQYKVLKKCDIGDIVGVEGVIFKTKTGEVSIYVEKFDMLCKTLRPLPEKFHGLQDTEIRYRQRYLDLIMNSDVKDVFIKRTRIIKAVKEFMDSKGFLEVETPVLQTVYGGAEARPFVTHINAWNMSMYLGVSPELFLKRLIVGGYDKVYTVCKNFRNEGVDKTHNPEFTMLEFYQAYVDYTEVMKLTEEMFDFVAKKVNGTTKIKVDGVELDLKAPWPRLSVKEALKKYADIDVDKLDDAELKAKLLGYNVEYEGDFTRGLAITLLFEELVEDKLTQPVFIIDFPKEASPLCKKKRGDDELIEKVEPYINGWELGNGYSELNDPILQKELLSAQAEELRAGFEEKHPMDEDFINSIEVGLPPTGGMGIGIDRMIILLTEQSSLRDVLLFPTMKPEVKEDKKK